VVTLAAILGQEHVHELRGLTGGQERHLLFAPQLKRNGQRHAAENSRDLASLPIHPPVQPGPTVRWVTQGHTPMEIRANPPGPPQSPRYLH
jgi:hypothetical protein